MDRALLTDEAIRAHDLQRWLSPEAEHALVAALRDRLAGIGLCLDAGVGTGRVALPLARAGVPMVGFDLSRAILGACRANIGPESVMPLVQGNLIRLPFPDGAFAAALAANVYHLIGEWRVAAAELVRVVQPDGVLLVNLGASDTSEIGRRMRVAFERYLGDRGGRAAEIGPHSPAEFDACWAAFGVTQVATVRVRDQQTRTIEELIARLEHNPFAWPGGVDEGARAEAAAATRAWAVDSLGPLDRPIREGRVITYRVYRVAQ